MAFTGTPVLLKLGPDSFRITGVSLAADATGTIGFDDKTVTAEVSISQSDWQSYTNSDDETVELADQVQVHITFLEGAVQPFVVTKTGTSHSDFAVSIHNENLLLASGDFEIIVRRDPI